MILNEIGLLKQVKQAGYTLLTLTSLATVFPWTNAYASSDDLVDLGDDASAVDGVDEILRERHSLLELVNNHFAFIREHPSMFMTSAQSIYAMILAEGKEEMNISGFGKVSVYNFFSKPNRVTAGRRIFGHYEGIKAVVDSIESQAKLEKSGVKVPLLVGTHGTGKTEFRETIANGLRYHTINTPQFYVYEISWNVESCKKIATLYNYLKTRQSNDFRSPMHSSPLALLPERYQQEIAKIAKPLMQKMINISEFVAAELDPISREIRDSILTHFANFHEDTFVVETLAALNITPKKRYGDLEKIRILSKFADMRRIILGERGTVPKIDAQGDEIDYAGIFLAENPVYRMLEGPSSPWAWNLGAIPTANRTLLFFDELMRNGPEMRDILLTTFESRTVSRGGSPTYPLDAVIIGATNTASVEYIKGDPRSAAHIDRMKIIPFDLNINPLEIAQVSLYMNGKQMKMKKLDSSAPRSTDDSAAETFEYEPMDIDQLFCRLRSSDKMATPDGRYALISGENEEEGVLIAPHALMMMADFIATTRISTDVKAAIAQSGGEQIINDPLFRDPIARIKALKGEQNYQASDLKALYDLSMKLREGSFGLSARDAGIWFQQAIVDARKTGNDRTLTPLLLRRTYEYLINTGGIQCPDLATQKRWKLLMDEVAKGILLPNLRQDIYSSFHSDGKAEDIYNEIIGEILALNGDTNAKEYDKDGHVQPINVKRLQKVREIYRKKVGTELSFPHIASFYMMQLLNKTKSDHRMIQDQGLLGSIHEYITQSLDAVISISNLLDFGEKNIGNKDVEKKFRSFEEVLKQRKGYNRRAILDALRSIKELDEKQ